MSWWPTGEWRKTLATERRLAAWVLSVALVCGAPLIWLFTRTEVPATAVAALGVAIAAWITVVAIEVRRELLRHVRVLSNLVESARRQDYSTKGVRAREDGELGELYQQINSLIDGLKVSRQSEQELLSILEKAVSEINVAIVVFDAHGRVRLTNQLASALLKSTPEQLIGKNGADTALAQLPVAAEPQLIDFKFPGAEGRWQVRQHSYRHQGKASRILFIADLKQVLTDQEIVSWQRLIRVISHEINNSLTPIISLSQTLAAILEKPRGAADESDVREGLAVIAERAQGLQSFISAYARLARLPQANKVLFPATDLANRLKPIFTGKPLQIVPFPQVNVFGDPVHLEHALINLIKNALEANPPTAPPVSLSCQVVDERIEFQIADNGPGIGNPDNLFVPFYTTKPEGAGIGLILCRQITAEHRGHVSLENRTDGPGAVARLLLPAMPEQRG